MSEPLLHQKTAATLLRISVRTLERHRIAGTGPRYYKIGRLVRYRASDLEDFVRRNVYESTSQYDP